MIPPLGPWEIDELDPRFRDWPEPCRPDCKPGSCICVDDDHEVGWLRAFAFDTCWGCQSGMPCRAGCYVQPALLEVSE